MKPLDEERESRSLLSNAVVVLQLVFGTLPLLLVVWAVDKLMNGTFSSTIVWGVGGVMILFALLRGVFYGTSIWRAHRSAYNALYTIEVAYHKSFATLAARFLSRTESWRLGEYY